MSAYIEGQAAARAGRAFADNPYTKPAKPTSGPEYPGEWALWASGWLRVGNSTSREFAEGMLELHEHTKAGLKP